MSALSHRLLRQVTKPARYTGGEWNSILKPWDAAALRVCLLYPDVYEVGAVRPGLSSLYQLLNSDPAVLAERAFAPWPDLASALRADPASSGLASLESGHPLREFDVLAVCLPQELSATTVLAMLDLARLPLQGAERDARCPLVMGWEERPVNPEPLADYLDAVLLGDAEEAVPGLLRAWRDLGGEAGRPPERADLLRRLASEPGVYVPSLYVVYHGADGVFQAAKPQAGVPAYVQRAAWRDLLPACSRPVVPFLQALPDRAVVEVQRGCDSSCPNVHLGLTALPLRQRPAAAAVAALQETLRSTGYEEVSLGEACLRDYPERERLIAAALDLCARRRATLRLPPLLLEVLTPGLVTALSAEPWGGPLTLGPAVAGPDLLEALRPGGALEQPLALLAGRGAEGVFRNLRLEIVLAHPSAPQGGWQAGADLVRAMRRSIGPQARLRVAVSFFVPRPFTPWQWAGQPPLAMLQEETAAFRHALGRRGGLVGGDAPERAQVEAALARGDRRLGAVVRRAWAAGCVLDTWDEHFRADLWREAFRAAGLDLEACAGRVWKTGAPLPWGHLEPSSEAELLADLFRSQVPLGQTPPAGGE
ncbi:MAG: hypothetical protein HY688_02165 [Chloroflexi bacterium]|nr:hypothetical protein [Chloroflexota bacterium]